MHPRATAWLPWDCGPFPRTSGLSFALSRLVLGSLSAWGSPLPGLFFALISAPSRIGLKSAGGMFD